MNIAQELAKLDAELKELQAEKLAFERKKWTLQKRLENFPSERQVQLAEQWGVPFDSNIDDAFTLQEKLDARIKAYSVVQTAKKERIASRVHGWWKRAF